MALRPLGRTGLMVSPIGLGTTKLGRNEQVKYPHPFDLPSDAAATALFELAKQQGVNLIDTAPAYGASERRLGELLPVPEDWVIATKVGEEFVDGWSRFDFSETAVRESVARSCRLLRRTRLDLVLLHCGDDDLATVRDSGAMQTLSNLKREGVVTAIGASTKSVEAGLAAVELSDVVMVTFNRTDRSQQPVIEAARRAGRGVLVKKALGSGHDGDPASALTEVLREPGVTAAIVGTIDSQHLRQNCSAVGMADLG